MAKIRGFNLQSKKGEGKKEKKEKLLWRNYPNRCTVLGDLSQLKRFFWEEFRNSGILTFASHRHYLELMVLGIHSCSRSLFRLVFR